MCAVCRERFAPFLSPEDESADPDAHFESYCTTVATTSEWGGHTELAALAGHLKRRIDVYAAGMPVQTVGEEYREEGRLTVCYLRHAFGLGDHYNSTKVGIVGADAEEVTEEDDDEEQRESEDHC